MSAWPLNYCCVTVCSLALINVMLMLRQHPNYVPVSLTFAEHCRPTGCLDNIISNSIASQHPPGCLIVSNMPMQITNMLSTPKPRVAFLAITHAMGGCHILPQSSLSCSSRHLGSVGDRPKAISIQWVCQYLLANNHLSLARTWRKDLEWMPAATPWTSCFFVKPVIVIFLDHLSQRAQSIVCPAFL
jgi:hypothetical protein